jgi:hypothetical protein
MFFVAQALQPPPVYALQVVTPRESPALHLDRYTIPASSPFLNSLNILTRHLQLGTLLGEFDLIGADTNTFQFDLNNVTIPHPKLWVSPHTNTGWRASEDDVARQQRMTPAQK